MFQFFKIKFYSSNTLDSIRAKDFQPLEQQERKQQEKRD